MGPVADQLEAYNERNIDRFLSCYHPNVKIEDGKGNLLMQGHEAMRAQYSALFDSSPNLHAHLMSRISVGDYVIDEENVTGRIAEGLPDRLHAVAIYQVESQKIIHVRFLW
ncbi:MAG: nuclear transport factor 2 family protein [Chloroflexota bacterium]